jgi:hypothetical protein
MCCPAGQRITIDMIGDDRFGDNRVGDDGGGDAIWSVMRYGR